MGNLPSLTYTIRHTLDRLQREHAYYQEEILVGRQLMFGLPGVATVSNNGVVSADDPASHLPGGSSPLAVSINSSITSTVDINPGYAVFNSGCWVELHDIVRQIQLADPTTGLPNVVYLQYRLEDATLTLNDGLQPVVAYTMRIGDPIDTTTLPESVMIGVATVSNYLSLPAATLADIVPLAIVTMQSTIDPGTGLLVTGLSIDHTRSSYSWNRPWFSAQDIYHRSQVGTGTLTPGNPHRTAIGDMTAGDFTLFQLLLDYGMVVADDKAVAKVPGYLCTGTFRSHYTDDALGTATGYANVDYIALPNYPVALGLCQIESTLDPFPGQLVPTTNLVVFPREKFPAGDGVIVSYTRVNACEPPLPGATTFQSQNPIEEELIVAGGAGVTALTNTQETMGDAYQFPQRYDFYVDGNGTLLKTPQVIYCWKQLDAIGASDVPTITQYGPGQLLLGLMGDHDFVGSGLSIGIRIYGTDTSGANINELLTFTEATWHDPGPIPKTTITPAAFAWSTLIFATVTNIVVETRVNSSPNAGIMLWALQTPYSNYDKMKDCLHVASAFWDGLRFSDSATQPTGVWDRRIVSTTVKPDVTVQDSLQNQLLITALAGGSATVFCEDLRRPKYHALIDINTTPQVHSSLQLSKWNVGTAGGYLSLAFPVFFGSGTNWRCTLLRQSHRDLAWFPGTPILYSHRLGVWTVTTMTAVAGVPGTYEVNLAAVPDRLMLSLMGVQANGYVLYG
jgi:hypothetical protein